MTLPEYRRGFQPADPSTEELISIHRTPRCHRDANHLVAYRLC